MPPDVRRALVIRAADQPGDLGWIVMANGEAYAEQFGWSAEFEALVARIIADFAAGHDPAREAAWIAEVDGERAGSILLLDGGEPGLAKLRVLLVTSPARGLGAGTALVATCLDFARAAAYERVTLWTNDVLTSARRIYEAAGFVLTDEAPHRSFGRDLVGRNWSLTLGG